MESAGEGGCKPTYTARRTRQSLAFARVPPRAASFLFRPSPRRTVTARRALSLFLSLSRAEFQNPFDARMMNLRAPIISTPPRASPTRDATRSRRARSRSPLALARARHPSSPSRTAHRSMNSTVQTNERLLSLASSSRRTRCDAMRFDALDRACVSRSIPRSIDRPVVAECRAPTHGRPHPNPSRGKLIPRARDASMGISHVDVRRSGSRSEFVDYISFPRVRARSKAM